MTKQPASHSRRAISSQDSQDLLSGLVELKDDRERREFLDNFAHLHNREGVERLTDKVSQLMHVDLQRAERLAFTALWLAEDLDDDHCRGRSFRAAANVSYLKGDYKSALDSYDGALACFERIGDERESGITRSSGLHTLVLLGDHERAFSWAQSARQIFKKLNDRLRLARLEGNFGNILFRQDRWQEAAECFRAAYEEFLHVGEPKDVAISLRNMAVCHLSLNNFMQALKFYEQARNYCQENDLSVLVGEIDYNVAYLLYLRGDYTRAIELYKTTRKKCEELGERYHMALCDLDLAEIFLELNLVNEAAELAQQAFANFEKLEMRYETAKALINLAIARNREGRAFLAVELLGKAREIFVAEQNQVWPALIDLYEALVLSRTGRLLEAARLAKRALDGFSAASLPTKTAICEILLARLLLERGRHTDAQDICRTALEKLHSIDEPALGHQAYYVLGQIEESVGSWDAARAAYSRSQMSLERLRSHIQAEELKIAFLEDKLSVYERLIWLIIQDNMGLEDKQAAFEYLEKAKARSLADLMAFRVHALPPTSATRSGQAEEVRKLREELNWYYRQIDLQEMSADGRSREEVDQLREISRRQEDHLLRTLYELQQTDQEFSSLQKAATVKIEDIQSYISEQTLLVEYYIARGTIYVCVIGRTRLEILPVTVATRAKELQRLLQFQLSKFLLGSDYIEEYLEAINEAMQSQLGELYEELIRPVQALLTGKHLVFIPHGFLHLVPFHALFDGEQFLIDRFTISYAPSASVYYLSCVKDVRPKAETLVLGVTNGTPRQVHRGAEAVAEIMPNSQLYVGDEASESVLRTHGESSSFLYIATQAVFRSDNPMFSAIKLGASHLNLFDLYGLKLGSEIVVLTGCGRGLEMGGNGDELVGLTRGLLYAGARSVVVTLWDAKDESAVLFLRCFCRSLNEGARKAEALRRAVLEVRKIYPNPFHWAAYLLVGEPHGA